jgi:hypothetical protein
MRKLILAIVAIAMLSVPVLAQTTGVPGQKFAWDQAAPDLATAQAYTYKHYDDGAQVGVAFTAVTCTGTVSPFACEVLIPAFTPGAHTLLLSASNVAGESPKSSPFAFTFVVTPGTPANIHIK